MNKFLLTIGFIFAISLANAQLNQVMLARKKGNLILAQQIIDSLTQTKTYENDAEAFFVKGLVCEDFYASTDSSILNQVFEPLFEASDAFNKALKINRKEISQLVNKEIESTLVKNILCEGYNLIENRKITDGIRYLELYLEYKPQDSITFLNIAVAADRINDTEIAIKYYEKLIQSSYKTPFLFKSLFYIYIKESKFENAEKMVLIAQKLYPNDMDVVKMNLNILLARKKYEEVKSEIRKVIADPKTADVTEFYYNLAQVYQIQDSLEVAITNYEETIKRDVTYFNAYFNIGGIYYEVAREIYDKVNAMDYRVYQKTGKIVEKKGHSLALKALPYLEKCYELNSQDEHNKEILISMYKNLKMNDKIQKIAATWSNNKL
jgi:tetratricopeptide (TPR) repeat protein